MWVAWEAKPQTGTRKVPGGKPGQLDRAGFSLLSTGLPFCRPFCCVSPFTSPLFRNCVPVRVLSLQFGGDEYLSDHFSSKSFYYGSNSGVFIHLCSSFCHSVHFIYIFKNLKACTRGKRGMILKFWSVKYPRVKIKKWFHNGFHNNVAQKCTWVFSEDELPAENSLFRCGWQMWKSSDMFHVWS